MASLEMVSAQMFKCAPSDSKKKEKHLKILVRDRVFPVDDAGSKEDGKSREVLECSSRSSVSETEESLQMISSPETNSNPFYNNLIVTENSSRNEFIMGASSLVQIWEARSQQSSPTRNHFLIDSKTSSTLNLFFESFNDNCEEVDWCLQSNISDSCEKERSSPPLVRIRGRQVFEDFLMMILRERKKDLKCIAGLAAVSKFSPRGCERLQYMLRIRSFERCVAIRERHLFKSAKRPSRGGGVINHRYKTSTGKPKIANKAIMSEDTSDKNGLKKPEFERKAIEEGEGSGETIEKGVVMGSVETNNELSIAEKVNLWDSKEINNRRRTMGKAKNEDKTAGRGIAVETIETDGYRVNPQEVTSVISLEKRKEEENSSSISRESSREERFSKEDEETSKAKKQETLSLLLESPRFGNGWDENDLEGEDEYEDYSGESVNYDWVSKISRPRSYWDDLRTQWELEVMNTHSKKHDIPRKLIKERMVSSILASDFREKIENILISTIQKRLKAESNHVNKEAECSAEHQDKLQESESENVDLETVVVYDGFSQDSSKSTMKTWSFEDHGTYPKDHENTSSGTQMISHLREEIEKMQREMLELKGFVKSSFDFQKFKSAPVSDPLQRNCCVCFDKPIDSLLYRCGHMCTCLKCGHELLWSTKKCPICMAPIIDVVRAFLDS